MARPRKPARLYRYNHRPNWYVLESGRKAESTGTACLGRALAVLKIRQCEGLRDEIPNSEAWAKEINKILRKARGRAKVRGLDYDISETDLRYALEAQAWKCELTNLPFSLGKSEVGRRQPFAPSLDRRDNRFGYVPGNIRLVCVIANLARADFSDDEFRVMCRAVASHT